MQERGFQQMEEDPSPLDTILDASSNASEPEPSQVSGPESPSKNRQVQWNGHGWPSIIG